MPSGGGSPDKLGDRWPVWTNRKDREPESGLYLATSPSMADAVIELEPDAPDMISAEKRGEIQAKYHQHHPTSICIASASG